MKQKIESIGPEAVVSATNFDGVARSDSSFMYFHNFLDKVLLLEQDETRPLFSLDSMLGYHFFNSTYNPLLGYNDLFLCSLIVDFSKNMKSQNSIFVFDSKKPDMSRAILPFPECYIDKYWGDAPYPYIPSFAFDFNEKRFFISFPVSNSIFVLDSSLRMSHAVDVRSNYSHKMKPFGKKRPKFRPQMYEHSGQLQLAKSVPKCPKVSQSVPKCPKVSQSVPKKVLTNYEI